MESHLNLTASLAYKCRRDMVVDGKEYKRGDYLPEAVVRELGQRRIRQMVEWRRLEALTMTPEIAQTTKQTLTLKHVGFGRFAVVDDQENRLTEPTAKEDALKELARLQGNMVAA